MATGTWLTWREGWAAAPRSAAAAAAAAANAAALSVASAEKRSVALRDHLAVVRNPRNMIYLPIDWLTYLMTSIKLYLIINIVFFFVLSDFAKIRRKSVTVTQASFHTEEVHM